jgi:hypothetical protein
MKLSFKGRVFATPSAVTILSNGVEIFSGQVGSGQPLDTVVDLYSTTITLPSTAQTLAISLSVTSGVITAGDVELLVDDYASAPVPAAPYLYPGAVTYDLRETILINGSLPEWPATAVTPMPGGTEANPVWAGWFFELAAGESTTFTVNIPALTAPGVPATPA